MTERVILDAALLAAREAAYPPGEFVGQESFMTGSAILALARDAGVVAGEHVLDACCGTGGPGRALARRTGCRITGVDADPGAIAVARAGAAGLDCTYEIARIPPMPRGEYDVVLLLETLLAFPDKAGVVAAAARALRSGGRFAFTAEEGMPLTPPERDAMPHADTVWPVPLVVLHRVLAAAGFIVGTMHDQTDAHRATAAALLSQYAHRRDEIAAAAGARFADDLIAAHELWVRWMTSGRIRRFAIVAHR